MMWMLMRRRCKMEPLEKLMLVDGMHIFGPLVVHYNYRHQDEVLAAALLAPKAKEHLANAGAAA